MSDSRLYAGMTAEECRRVAEAMKVSGLVKVTAAAPGARPPLGKSKIVPMEQPVESGTLGKNVTRMCPKCKRAVGAMVTAYGDQLLRHRERVDIRGNGNGALCDGIGMVLER